MSSINIYRNLSPKTLLDHALNNHEGIRASNGALVVTTGKRTGRSPKDRFIVRDKLTENTVDWGTVNQPMTPEVFSKLWQTSSDYLKEKTHYVSELAVGSDSNYCIPVKVTTETAWHNLFAHNLFLRDHDTSQSIFEPWTILSVPSLPTDPAIDKTNSDGVVAINFSEHKVLIRGIAYAGEMKKSMFSVLNFLLPKENVLPMHCAANAGKNGDVTLFFGLSGTGKTTLSADPGRFLIGDDEHGWSRDGVFNFEGGCYAKCINLSQEAEPMIWDAIREGSVLENVVLNPQTFEPDYRDSSLTQNTRAVYPREHIEKRVPSNQGQTPNAVVFLTCDLYGVLPPIALLTPQQAVYYFLSGYTALVGSTEVGSAPGVNPTFSTCFGAPFFPRSAQVYADLLLQRLSESGAQVYLVNTGWYGGVYEQGGKRFPISVSRAIISSIISGALLNAETTLLPGFNLSIPTEIKGVENKFLDPRKTWSDSDAYQKQARTLINAFIKNFSRFKVDNDIRAAEPHLTD